MVMSRQLRRFALSVHLTCSVGWIGGVIAYLAMGITATRAPSPTTVRAMWLAMETVGWYVLVPLALGSWATGLFMALGTRWGLFRYYWVIFAFVLTTLATIILILHMPDVSATQAAVAIAPAADLDHYGGDLVHTSIALVLLLVVQVLNLYKPPGVTPYGWRKTNRPREVGAS